MPMSFNTATAKLISQHIQLKHFNKNYRINKRSAHLPHYNFHILGAV